ncbi:MAG: ribosome-associated translation inhibitor RaiA [Candidatus Shapirobacteria bacterium]|jgi:ribosomal subunit interface protein
MNIKVIGLNFTISPSIHELIQEKFIDKLDQLISNFNDELKTGFLSLEKDKRHKIYQAKFDMTLPGKKNSIFAQHSHPDLTAAITGLREAIEKQIKKYKHTN